MNKALLTNIAVGAGGAAVGGFAGFLIAKKALEKKYRAIAEAEINSVREAYAADLERFKEVPKNQKFDTPEEAAAALRDKRDVLTAEEAELYNAQRIEQGEQLVKTLTEQEYIEQPEPIKTSYNIWDGPGVTNPDAAEEPATDDDPDWPGNPEDEEPGEFTTLDGPTVERSADVPYIIKSEEYYAEADGFNKLLLVFFEEDAVLTDEADRPLNDVERTVGKDNLNQFGFLSQDKDIVYVRNERLRSDFEIRRDEASYAKTFLHRSRVPAERKPKPQKMRENE